MTVENYFHTLGFEYVFHRHLKRAFTIKIKNKKPQKMLTSNNKILLFP